MKRVQLAKQLIEEKSIDGICTLSKKKLGEILHQRYPDLFTDAENGRQVIRAITGASGTRKREKIKTRIEWNGFNLPEQEKNDYSKVILNEKRIGILSDIHFPYADMTSLNAAVSYLIDFEPDCIILNGDTLDMYHASNFEKDPRQRSIKYELDVCRNFLIQLKELFPKAKIVYKAGNHCERYEKKILERLPEFVDLEWTTLEYALGLHQIGIQIVKNKRIIKAGDLNICHGHEFSKGFIAPVNVARGFYLRAKANVIAGHHHRISEHMEQDINGKQIGTWSTGCLCELNPKYMPINNWQHGFATVEIINNEGNFRVKNLKIINGEVL
jgi:predicted phosphodiesterase